MSFLQAVLWEVTLWSNLGIAFGYCCAAALTFPGVNPVVWNRLRIKLWQTRICGTLFFVTCASTHIELFLHTRVGITSADMYSWHMAVIHSLQMFAVWGFLLGIVRELRRPEDRTAP